MLKMRDHDVEDYTSLRDMDKTDVGVLSDDDRNCLAEIGRYIVEAGADQRFALWLLHKHFEPNAGEVFVERALFAPRRTETTLEDRAAYAGKVLNTTAFRFDDSVTSGVGIIGMEFAEPDAFGSTAPLSADDETVLAGVAERLAAHGKTGRFGIRLIRDPLDLLEHELLLETNDDSVRTLYCDISDRDAVLSPGSNTIETSWRWQLEDGQGEPVVMMSCHSICQIDPVKGHYQNHRNHHGGR